MKKNNLKFKKEPGKRNNEISFEEFLNKAKVIVVDNAFSFDINKWKKEKKEIRNPKTSINK